MNKDKTKEYQRNYYLQNKDKMKDSYQEYRIQNKEKIKNLKREYRIQNRDKIKEYDREYRTQNKEKIKEWFREYRIQNKDKIKEYDREYYIKNQEKMKDFYNAHKDEIKVFKQQYYLQNKDKIKESHKDYCIQNKDKIKELRRKYYLKNKLKSNEYNRKYHIQNQDKMKEYKRIYSIKNKDKIKAYQIKNRDKIKQYFINKNIERNNGIYVPLNSWKTSESLIEYFERIAPLLHINDLSDWYRISRLQIIDKKGSRLFSLYSSLGEALKVAYPDYDWDMSKFSLRVKKSSQRWLYVKLKKLLPNSEIVEEFHHPELLWEDNTNKSMQLDIWVSEFKLALEYQGEHHYNELPGAFGPGSTTQIFRERDEKKKQICAAKGINLVCIPYWWNGHEDSLSSTLHTILPDVFHKTGSPPIEDYVKNGRKE